MGTTSTIQKATLDELAREEGKAELIQGRIERLMPTGDLPSEVAQNIFVSLRSHAKATGTGVAKADGVGFAVPELPSGRESFSPDASYYVGPRPRNRMRFIEGAPTFAAEVRSENDYSLAAETAMAAKRDDYFAAGSLVVWDVDPLVQRVNIYRADNPTSPDIRERGDSADAEPAVPGWRIAVDEVFGN
ncbi:MAG: Uma2 family endonuclease [Planctomycetes bacterium]|nr:Uma2 family endonuclease [Planctomycetota bacterium]